MASHRTSTDKSNVFRVRPQSGLTLIEVLIVISIMTMLIGSTLFFDIGNFRGTSFNAEVGNMVTALQTARADALNNVHQAKHGVAINPTGISGFVIFDGNDYAHRDTTRDTVIPSMYRIELVSPSPSEIVFTQLSGNTPFNGDVVMRDPNRNVTTNVAINFEGRISW